MRGWRKSFPESEPMVRELRTGRWRLAAVLGVFAVAMCGLLLAAAPGTAQDDPAPADEELSVEEETTPAPAAASREEKKSDGDSESLLDLMIAGGIEGALIGILSLVGVGFAIEHALTIRRAVIAPEHTTQEIEQLIQQGQVDQALEACRQPHNESLFASVVEAGLERYKSSEFGFAEYKAAAEEEGEEQTSKLYRKTEVLGVVGTIAPMLGLLGTVRGMIIAFNEIARSGGAAEPSDLADGIRLALITTLQGLIVAIPAMIAFSWFRNRIDSLVSEAGKRVEQVLAPLGRRR